MKTLAPFALACTLLVLGAAVAKAQPTQIWSASMPYPRTVGAKAVVDSQGNVYVADAGDDGTTSPTVTKFSSTGQVLWVGHGPHEPRGDTVGIKLMPDGGVLAGFHHEVHDGRTDSTIQKFSANGALQWYRYTQQSYLYNFDVDSSGNFYGDYGTFVIKRKPNAETIWTVYPQGAHDAFEFITLDQNGGVYISIAETDTVDPTLWMTAHVNASGSIISQVPSHATGTPMILRNGFLYGIGSNVVLDSNQHIQFVAAAYKLDSDMNTMWTTSTDVLTGGHVFQTAVDSQGNFFTSSYGNTGGPTPVVTTKYDTNGNVVFQKSFAGAAIGSAVNYPIDMKTDAAGNVFVLMYLYMRLGLANEGNWTDYGIIQYDPAGNTVWPDSGGSFFNGAIIYDSGMNEEDDGGMGFDAMGNILIGGTAHNFSGPQIYQVEAAKFGTPDSSSFNFQFVPTTMQAGHTYQVTVGFKNTGSSTWTFADGYSLESRNPSRNTIWGITDVPISPSYPIAPGGSKGFVFTVTAPSTPGHYNFQWQVTKAGEGGFGALSPNLSINVTS